MTSELDKVPFSEFHVYERDGRSTHVVLTAALQKRAVKEGIWGSRELCVTLKNAAYGYSEERSRSVGGKDGIFLMDRTFRPRNEMMRKLFDRFLDSDNGRALEVAEALSVALSTLVPVRLVSHHLRLLGVLARKPAADWLVLVDFDRSTD